MAIRCAVIDDEPLALNMMSGYVTKTPGLILEGAFFNAIDALKSLVESPVDLIFLDIQMPLVNGLEFSKMINKNIGIIFTTAFSQYAIEGFKLNAVDYLMKPITYNNFLSSVEKAKNVFKTKLTVDEASPKTMDSIFIKTDYHLKRIKLEEIIYIEGKRDYIAFHTINDEPVLSLMTLKKIEQILQDSYFTRVHRSFIVNMKAISTIDRNRIVFGKNYVPISATYKDSFMQKFSDQVINLQCRLHR